MEKDKVFSLSRLARYWSTGLRLFFMQLMYDTALGALLTITILLTFPISLIFIDTPVGTLLPMLFIVLFILVYIPVLGLLFGDQIFLFCTLDTIGPLNESDRETMQEDAKWGAPGRFLRWFRAWVRGMMSLFFVCVPRFIITVPLLVLLLFTIAAADRFKRHPMEFFLTLTALLLWASAAPALAGALGGWLLKKMFAKWELYALLHPGHMGRPAVRTSNREAIRQFNANSRKRK